MTRMDTGPMKADLTDLYEHIFQARVVGHLPRLVRRALTNGRIRELAADLAAIHAVALAHYADYATGQPAWRRVVADTNPGGRPRVIPR